ncbi:hypothetical protein LDO26_04435 [Luteimonas sp. BDR2-5]|uniref:hypothetical protein n=1 Tax=Proluteimonas luteida TaxID=2878685 RepID=UPI001E442C07|nr:hypothetical protein [Luteimonas sp. BDR2-5]MCD9027462.1 hypothetical protein [Luteimonas sp. BDR2-5]
MKSMTAVRTGLCLPLLLLAACASQAPVADETAPPATSATAQEMVALIRASGGDGEGELAVQPLRDPMVDDLREQALALEARGDVPAAVVALDQALEIVADDPALLQERAELAVLQQDYAAAATLAERAYAIGSQLGPLCRRHWTTLEQVRLAGGDVAGAAQARAQVDGCRVSGPERY